MAPWLYGRMAACPRDCLGVWPHVCKAAWLHGAMAVWPRGCMTVRMRDRVVDQVLVTSILTILTPLAADQVRVTRRCMRGRCRRVLCGEFMRDW